MTFDDYLAATEGERLRIREVVLPPSPGLTLRDQFAMAALQGLLSSSDSFYQAEKLVAAAAYSIADDMLKEREVVVL